MKSYKNNLYGMKHYNLDLTTIIMTLLDADGNVYVQILRETNKVF